MKSPIQPLRRIKRPASMALAATGALVLAVAAYGDHTAQQQQANNAEAEEAAAIASRQWAAEVICEGNRYHWADAHTLVCQPTPSAQPAAHTPLSYPIASQQ